MIRTEDIAFFKSIVGEQLSLLDADLKHYGHEEQNFKFTTFLSYEAYNPCLSFICC